MRTLFLSLIAVLLGAATAVHAADGYLMQESKMMMFKDGRTAPLDSETTLADGTKVLPEGTVIRSNGKRIRLSNGMMIDMGSNILVRDGVLMKEGKMMLLKDGDLTPMSEEVVMSNGTRVTPDGSVVTRMKEGEMMMMDGTATTTKGPMKSKQGKF